MSVLCGIGETREAADADLARLEYMQKHGNQGGQSVSHIKPSYTCPVCGKEMVGETAPADPGVVWYGCGSDDRQGAHYTMVRVLADE